MALRNLPPEHVATLKAFQSGTALPFRVKMRGYNRRQVGPYFYKFAGLVNDENPPALESPAFEVVMRGYDRAQVDAFLAVILQPPERMDLDARS